MPKAVNNICCIKYMIILGSSMSDGTRGATLYFKEVSSQLDWGLRLRILNCSSHLSSHIINERLQTDNEAAMKTYHHMPGLVLCHRWFARPITARWCNHVFYTSRSGIKW